jgi:CheY-like chemotaxis protein
MRSHVQTAASKGPPLKPRKRKVARVLLADAGLASRLAIKTILSTAGYAVSGAATAAEAIGKLDEHEYQLVLADLRAESEEAGPRLLAYARQKDFHPATALLSSDMSETGGWETAGSPENRAIHMSNDNVYHLLNRVAELISQRADRRIRKSLVKAS